MNVERKSKTQCYNAEKIFFCSFLISPAQVSSSKFLMMSKRQKKEVNPFKSFLAGELYKIFNRHPAKTFNHKQLSKLIKPLAVEFIKKQIPGFMFMALKGHQRMRITTNLRITAWDKRSATTDEISTN